MPSIALSDILPVGFPGGVNSGIKAQPRTRWLMLFKWDIKQTSNVLRVEAPTTDTASLARLMFHLEAPSNMYICVCMALHLHPKNENAQIQSAILLNWGDTNLMTQL